MFNIGFDNAQYIKLQSEHILNRINQNENKLYLEFGGKLFDDFHASRVLPGFEPDIKIRLLKTLADKTEIIMVINAADIEENRLQGDYGITYGDDLLRLVKAFRGDGLYVSSVVITQYLDRNAVKQYVHRLEQIDIKVYKHYTIDEYPANIPYILSDDGFGKNDYVETTQPLVVITAPGSSSGKMATCLSQLYHEYQRGIKAGYAKFETFPVWNLPLSHPVNIAYEAATTNVNDTNMIDPFHLDAYGISAINYNRDIEGFPLLNAIFTQLYGQTPYKSPTDMGVNMAGFCISDDAICRYASKQEIIRRYYAAVCKDRMFGGIKSEILKLELLMNTVGVTMHDRKVVTAALEKEAESETPSVAIELACGTIIKGKTTPLLGSASTSLLNALKHLANVPKALKLIPPDMIEPIQKLKTGFLGNNNPRLHTDEALIALSICSANSDTALHVLEQLPKLKNSEAHSTVILSQVDIAVFKKLGINITCEPRYQSKKIYQ